MLLPANPLQSTHVWLITEDVITRKLNATLGNDDAPQEHITGPGAAPDTLIEAVTAGTTPAGQVRHTFRLYDDDGELYYRGVMLMPEDTEGDEDHLGAPLDDWGMPNAGCTRISWDGHSEWEIR